ncbi:low molecular weight protein-tyrosine-phosphatase [Croceimicrobium sp.]|uniref:low molecular weight protein-tyrosine-phosphatase n=1 Tax=Croceimicrobium sp. TaxID=2828340 RepID=UPI003BAA9B75
MKKVLMVCLGNICRSPLAEGLLRSKVNPEEVEVDSAGTAAYHVGEAPDIRTIMTGRKHGINLSNLVGRQFKTVDFDYFDRIYVMDHSNLNNVLNMARNEADRAKVDLILNEIKAGSNQDVPDPYYGGDEGFEQVYRLLDAATDTIVEKLKDGRI